MSIPKSDEVGGGYAKHFFVAVETRQAVVFPVGEKENLRHFMLIGIAQGKRVRTVRHTRYNLMDMVS